MRQFIYDLKYRPFDALNIIYHTFLFAAIFAFLGYTIPQLYYIYFDKTNYYQITSPITLEKKNNRVCDFVDVYINRKVLAPIVGTSVRQLTLIRQDNGLKQRMQSYKTEVQADIGEMTVIAHWGLPCDIPVGSYYFEGTVQYKVHGLDKFTHFFTENFNIIATPESEIKN